jgi:hypothetical protein
MKKASLALIIEKGKILAVNKNDDLRWGLPGGKEELGESSPHAAIRELLEETGHLCLDEYPELIFEDVEGEFDVCTYKISRTVKLSGPLMESFICKFVTPETLINPQKARFPKYNARLISSLKIWTSPPAPRRIFILGASQSGKTTLAKKLVSKLKCLHISAGAWARALCDSDNRDSLEESSSQELRCNPDYAINWINACSSKVNDNDHDIVIEGIRNPRDFHSLWNPNRDVCIFILNGNGDSEYKGFDFGVLAIEESVAWWKENIALDRLTSPSYVLMSEFDSFVENFV